MGDPDPAGFVLLISGQIADAEVPSTGRAYCKFQLLHGEDWQKLGGAQDGITQITRASGQRRLAWNFPVDVAYRATSAFGWPQLVLCVYGADWAGRDVLKGYGAVHVPTSIGRFDLKVHLFRPLSATWLQQCFGWATGMPAELADPRLPALADGREVLRVKAGGHVRVQLNLVTQEMDALGFDDGSRSSNAGVIKTS